MLQLQLFDWEKYENEGFCNNRVIVGLLSWLVCIGPSPASKQGSTQTTKMEGKKVSNGFPAL